MLSSLVLIHRLLTRMILFRVVDSIPFTCYYCIRAISPVADYSWTVLENIADHNYIYSSLDLLLYLREGEGLVEIFEVINFEILISVLQYPVAELIVLVTNFRIHCSIACRWSLTWTRRARGRWRLRRRAAAGIQTPGAQPSENFWAFSC